jgi:hypothetical protein
MSRLGPDLRRDPMVGSSAQTPPASPRTVPIPCAALSVGTTSVRVSAVKSAVRGRTAPAPRRTAEVEPGLVAHARRARNVAPAPPARVAAHRNRRRGRPKPERFSRHRPSRRRLRTAQAKADQHAGREPKLHNSLMHDLTSLIWGSEPITVSWALLRQGPTVALRLLLKSPGSGLCPATS